MDGEVPQRGIPVVRPDVRFERGLSGGVVARDALLRVRVTRAGLDALDAKARRLDITRSAAVRAALAEWTRR